MPGVQPRPTSEPRLLRAIDTVVRAAAVVGGIALLVMCLNVVTDVALRNLANRPLPGTLDHVAYLWMPAAALLGLGIAHIKDEHIRVTLLLDQAPYQTRRWSLIAADLVTGLLVAWMAYLAFDALVASVRVFESSTLGNPIWPARIFVFAAFAVFELGIVARIFRLWRNQLPPTEIEAIASTETSDAR